jgi:hypothetical protein
MPPPPPERWNGRNHDWMHLLQRRRHLDARHVGVPVVRRLGSRLSHGGARARRSGFCQAPAHHVDARVVHAPERPDSRRTSGPSATSTRRCKPGRPTASSRSSTRCTALPTTLFLERVFQKLLLNFTWWVNREDPTGENVFMGGFLGLDNIGVFDRSAPLPTGGHIVQSDATSWMAVYALDMMAIALELAQHDPSYEDIASKFFEHFLYIAYAINNKETEPGSGTSTTASTTTSSYSRGRYVVCRCACGRPSACCRCWRSRPSHPQLLDRLPNFKRRFEWFIAHRPGVAKQRRLPGILGMSVAPAAGASRRRTLAPACCQRHARRERVPQPARHPLALEVPSGPPVRRRQRGNGVARRLRARRIDRADFSAATPTGAGPSGFR